MAHAGGSYEVATAEGLASYAELERANAVSAAELLRSAGIPCAIVSVGSTPTALFARALDGVTEVRAGVYMFFDLVMAGIGVCRTDEIALSVLTAVIGHQRERNQIIVDAGWMALSRDRGTQSQAVDQGYGLVCDANGQPMDDLVVVAANQEHGLVADRQGRSIELHRWPIGTLLRILPNHACATAGQHDRYHVMNTGGATEAVWPRFGGW
jgi:D-serine deaminase-like pyridoxal phosphate-dependent protein